MITKVTKDNQVKYTALFNDANKVLNISQDDASAIGSIEEYFQAFGSITTASSATKFIALPLDEPVFEINADTREIKVPSAFATYGLSVKGDQRAEIVYFSIDRYFDTTDLYNPVTETNKDGIRIIIQWETLQSGATKTRGVSKAIFEDVEILKDQKKMLFGWAINNAITEFTGTVRFSVRFYSINNDNEVTFSLSTLTANAAIKDGLDFQIDNGEFTTDFYDDAQAIRDRFRNSIVTDEEVLPEAPIFFYDGIPVLPTSDGFMIDDQWYVDLDPNTEKYQLKVQAYSTDGGSGKMVYVWNYNGSWNGVSAEKMSNATYVATEDTEWNANKLYYYFTTASGIEEYMLDTVDRTTVTLAEEKEDRGELFERFGSCDADAAGTYTAKALNRQKKNGVAGEEGLYSAETESVSVIIPGPGELTVETDVENEVDGVYQVIATSAADEETQVIATKAELMVIGTTTHSTWGEGKQDHITYEWKAATDEETETLSTDAIYTVNLSELTDAELALYDQSFKVDVIASRNKVNTEAQSKVFRVTAPARAFAVVPVQTRYLADGVSGMATIAVSLDNYAEILSDDMICKWYKANSLSDLTDDEEIIGEAIYDAENHTYSIEVPQGLYCCRITNIVNGSEATNAIDSSVSSPDFITVS